MASDQTSGLAATNAPLTGAVEEVILEVERVKDEIDLQSDLTDEGLVHPLDRCGRATGPADRSTLCRFRPASPEVDPFPTTAPAAPHGLLRPAS